MLLKEGCNDIAVKLILRRLDKVLKKLLRYFLATHPGHEVENVEIKGTPHLITWAHGKQRRIQSMQSGDLAKLPRDLFFRFEEFENTTVLSFDDIHELERKVERLEIVSPIKLSVVQAKGSTSGHPIPSEEVEAMSDGYLELARTWLTEPMGTSSRAKVEAEDLAIALGIVKFCTAKPNLDGSMPTSRIKVIWDRLYEEGEVARGFDYHRWRVVRDLIESQGGLDMVDRRYYTGFVDEQGHEVRGRAARWHMAEWLVEKLDAIRCSEFEEAQTREGGTLLEHLSDSTLIDFSCDRKRGTLLEQQEEEKQGNLILSLDTMQGGSFLEQQDEENEDYGFDDNWIVEFRREEQGRIGDLPHGRSTMKAL